MMSKDHGKASLAINKATQAESIHENWDTLLFAPKPANANIYHKNSLLWIGSVAFEDTSSKPSVSGSAFLLENIKRG